MFRVFEVMSEDQKYQLDVLEKYNDTFEVKIKIMKSKNVKAMIDNFRRNGHVRGGGCVKFLNVRKIL